MTNKKKIMHIVWSGHIGGAERFVRDILIHSNKERFAHTVMILSDSSWLSDQMSQMGVQWFCIGMKNGLSFSHIRTIKQIVAQEKPDIIHNHCRNFLFNLFFICERIPGMYFEHGGDILGNNRWRDILFYKFLARYYNLILVNSNTVKKQVSRIMGIDNEKLKVLYIGIDPERYDHTKKRKKRIQLLGAPGKKYVVGTIARLVEQKGIDDFVITASEIYKREKDVSFIVIGDGEKRDELEKLAQRLAVPIHFTGFRFDVPDILSAFDVFLMTSKWEPFGITVLEAMATKVPIIGFAVDGVQELIDAGGGGVLINKRCHEALAKTVLDIIHDRKRLILLRKQGASSVRKNFHITGCINRLEHYYLVVLGKEDEDSINK